MLVTYVGDEITVTVRPFRSSTSKNCHRHLVTNITIVTIKLLETTLWPKKFCFPKKPEMISLVQDIENHFIQVAFLLYDDILERNQSIRHFFENFLTHINSAFSTRVRNHEKYRSREKSCFIFF